MTVVLDASAFLALAYDEPGADRVSARLENCAISAVNAAEIASKLEERGTPRAEAERLWTHVERLSRDFTAAQARLCGSLRQKTRAAGLSLGDRACLALAQELGAQVLTADRAWAGLDLGVEIEVIR